MIVNGRGTSRLQLAAWTTIGCGLACILLAARTDRAADRDVTRRNRQTVSLRPVPAGPVAEAQGARGAPPSKDPEQAVRDAEAMARATQEELARVKDSLEVMQRELERVKAESATGEALKQRELANNSASLEQQREKLEAAAQAANETVVRARQQLTEVNEERDRRLRVFAEEGIARAAARENRLEMRIRHDPRRLRDPNLRPFEANAAAVAAAGAGGSGGGGFGGGIMMPGSTPAGDAARGYAAMIAAQGEANLRNSQAAINTQTSMAMGMDNRLRWTETFFEMRRINRAARALEEGPAVSMQDAVRMAAEERPRRLTARELDPVTGDITWPIVLTDPLYRYQVSEIQDRFHQRADAGGYVTFEQSAVLGESIDKLVGLLKDNVKKYAAGKYGVARTFLDSLRQEFELPMN